LTVAAEIAGVGALVVAIAALIVVVFFDTGVRMPWNSGANVQPSATTAPVSSSTSSAARRNPSDQRADSTPGSKMEVTAKDSTTEPSRSHDDFWTSWLGLCFAALVAYLVVAIVSIVIGFLVDALFVPDNPAAVGVAISTPLVSMLYLWLFWPFLSVFGSILFVALTAVAAVCLAFVLEDWIL
jgi:hypothetical protein